MVWGMDFTPKISQTSSKPDRNLHFFNFELFLATPEEADPMVPTSVLRCAPTTRLSTFNPVTWNFIRKMSFPPALLCPSRELFVLPAIQASLPVGSTCVKWSAGHCCAAQMRMETEGSMIWNPPNQERVWKSDMAPQKKKNKSTTACPTVTGRKWEMKSNQLLYNSYSYYRTNQSQFSSPCRHCRLTTLYLAETSTSYLSTNSCALNTCYA